MNPVGKVPVMTDGDMKMFESCAMMQYVLDRYGDGKLQPAKDNPTYAHYLQWSWFAEATFARPLGEIVNHRREFKPELRRCCRRDEKPSDRCRPCDRRSRRGSALSLGRQMSAADLSICYAMRGYRRMVTEDFRGTYRAFRPGHGAPSYERTVVADAATAERLKA